MKQNNKKAVNDVLSLTALAFYAINLYVIHKFCLCNCFRICEYIGVVSRKLFNENINEPQNVRGLYKFARNIYQEALDVLISTADRLNNR